MGGNDETTIRLDPAPEPLPDPGSRAVVRDAHFGEAEPPEDAGTDLMFRPPGLRARPEPPRASAPQRPTSAEPPPEHIAPAPRDMPPPRRPSASSLTPAVGLRIDESIVASEPEVPAMVRAFVADAERRAASGDYEGIVKVAATLRTAFNRSIDSPADGRNRALPWVNLLDGEARLLMSDPEGAIGPLVAAVDGGDGALRARASWTLGRALFAAGRSSAAESSLLHGLKVWHPPLEEHIEGLSILAEISMVSGDLPRAEGWLGQALQLSRDAGYAAGIALVDRGLARCATLRGRGYEALDPLRDALRVLGDAPRPEAIAPVLLDVVVIQTLLGRYATALEYADAAGTWTRALPALAARTAVLRAEVEALLGMHAEASASIELARSWLVEHVPRTPDLPLRAARVLCTLDRSVAAVELLDQLIEPEPSAAEDLFGQVLAVRARAVAQTDPQNARGLASAALGRRPPASPVAAAQIRLDAARALIASGTPAAGRSAAKKGVKFLQRTGNRGLKLELLLVIVELGAEANNVDTIRKAAEQLLAELPAPLAASFAARPDLEGLLEARP